MEKQRKRTEDVDPMEVQPASKRSRSEGNHENMPLLSPKKEKEIPEEVFYEVKVEEYEVNQCRGCRMQGVHGLFSIHEEGLKELFSLLTGIEIKDDDPAPNFLCEFCRGQLLSFSLFRTTCIESNSYFIEKMNENLLAIETEREIFMDIMQERIKDDDQTNNDPLENEIIDQAAMQGPASLEKMYILVKASYALAKETNSLVKNHQKEIKNSIKGLRRPIRTIEKHVEQQNVEVVQELDALDEKFDFPLGSVEKLNELDSFIGESKENRILALNKFLKKAPSNDPSAATSNIMGYLMTTELCKSYSMKGFSTHGIKKHAFVHLNNLMLLLDDVFSARGYDISIMRKKIRDNLSNRGANRTGKTIV